MAALHRIFDDQAKHLGGDKRRHVTVDLAHVGHCGTRHRRQQLTDAVVASRAGEVQRDVGTTVGRAVVGRHQEATLGIDPLRQVFERHWLQAVPGELVGSGHRCPAAGRRALDDTPPDLEGDRSGPVSGQQVVHGQRPRPDGLDQLSRRARNQHWP